MCAQWQPTQYQHKQVPFVLSGGINTGMPSFDVNDSQYISGNGWDTEANPDLQMARGRVSYGASGGAQTNLLTHFSDQHLFRAVGTKFQYYNGSAWTDIPGTFTDISWNAANFSSISQGTKLLLTNGTDSVQTWDGSTLSALTAAPKGKYITVHKGFVFIANGTTIYWSSFDNISDWTSPEDSGSKGYYTANGGNITGIYSYSNQVVVFKADTYAEIFGTDYYNFQFVENSNRIGCINFKTIVEVRNNLLWLGQTDVYMYQGGRPQPIGEPIRKYLDSINRTYIDKCCAFSDEIRYYLCLVTGSNTEPDTILAFDLRYNYWTVGNIGYNYRYGTRFNNSTYVGDSTGQTYQEFTGTTNNGTTMSWSVETKDFTENVPEQDKEYFSLHIQLLAPTGTTLTVEASVDQGTTYYAVGDPIATSPNAQMQSIIIPLDTIPIGNWVRFRLSGSGPVTIYRIIRLFNILPLDIY